MRTLVGVCAFFSARMAVQGCSACDTKAQARQPRVYYFAVLSFGRSFGRLYYAHYLPYEESVDGVFRFGYRFDCREISCVNCV